MPTLLTSMCAFPQRSVTSANSRSQSSQRPASNACAEARRAGGDELLDDALTGGALATGDGNRGARARETARDGESQAAACARDDGNLSGELDCAHAPAAKAASTAVISDFSHIVSLKLAPPDSRSNTSRALFLHRQRSAMRSVRAEGDVEQMNGLERPSLGQLPSGAIRERARSAGELDEVGIDARSRHAIQGSGGIVMKPAGILFPDRPHVPRDLAVKLADLELRRQLDLAHERMHVLARIHAGDGRIVHVGNRRMHLVEIGPDFRSAADRLPVTGDEHLGAELAHLIERAEIALHGARLVAAHGA